jgi:hypothetical protein
MTEHFPDFVLEEASPTTSPAAPLLALQGNPVRRKSVGLGEIKAGDTGAPALNTLELSASSPAPVSRDARVSLLYLINYPPVKLAVLCIFGLRSCVYLD